jgi:myo-inositol-1(or 4)-monophosphatase
MHPVLNVAVEAAHAAAKIMRRQMQHVEAIPVERKARHDYVSEVDRACEAEIVREIKRFYPDHAFLCEEGGATGDSNLLWIIDPLDGTSNYLHGLPHFAVSIAQQVDGRTEHAVVYDPIRDELFTASRGSGAYMNNKRMRVSARNGLDGAILATAFPFRSRDKLQAYARVFQSVFAKVEDFRRAGTASLDLAWVAAGRMDGYFEVGLKAWDVAAGALLVREAGGVVLDFDGNDAVEEAETIIAAPYKVMTPLRQLISSKWKTT